MVTRAEVIQRASTLWRAGTVPYSQSTIHSTTGYRQDCSGFVSMCWGIPLDSGSWGGENTVTLVTEGWMYEIPPADLKPGDAVGICGPGSAGDAGHIVIFERWVNDDPNNDDYWLWEQAGGRSGPTRRVLTYPYGGPWGQWKAYRFRGIQDSAPPIPPTPTPNPGGNPVANQYDGIKDVVLMNGPPGGTRLGDVWGRTLGNAESAKVAAQAAQAGVAELLGRPATVSIELRPEDVDRIAAQVAERITDTVAQAVVDKLTAWLTR